MIEVYSHELFDGLRVIVLFTNPLEVAAVVEARVPLSSVNIGAMGYLSWGKKMISNTIAVDQQDIEAFRYLHTRGIELEIRKVITDNKQLLWDVLKRQRYSNC